MTANRYIGLRINSLFEIGHAGFSRANFGTFAAIIAKLRIDYIYRISGKNRIFGAFGNAGITHYTFAVYYISQLHYLQLKIRINN